MPNNQQAKLRAFIQSKIPDRKVNETARRAGMSPSTLHGFLDGNDALGELSAIKLSKILGSEIELLFYNDGYEPAKTNNTRDEEGKRARKAHAIREIERLIDSIGDAGERERAWDVVLGTTRAYADAVARDGKAASGAGDVEGDAVRGGRGRAGAGADAGEVSNLGG